MKISESCSIVKPLSILNFFNFNPKFILSPS
nr:MAG TPA: hypothetical protein [Caudoviricetes sp.]